MSTTIEQVHAAFRASSHSALSLADLNAILRENGAGGLTETSALALGLVVRRRLSRAGKVRNIVVGLTKEGVDGYSAIWPRSVRQPKRDPQRS